MGDPTDRAGAGGEERFRRLFEHAPMGVHTYRLEGGDRLVFRGGNPAADRILGIPHAQLVGATIEEAFPPLGLTEVPGRYRALARDGGEWSTEQIDYRDGRIAGAFEVHAFQLAPGEMAAVFQDITRRKQVEEALRISEEKYRLLVDAQEDLLIQAELGGTLTYVSPSVCRFYGRTAAQLLAVPFFEMVHPDDRAAVAAEIARATAEDGQGRVEHRTVTPRGERRLAWTGRVVLDALGHPTAFVATGRDITERREMEARLRQSEKLQAIGQLAGGVAHDFNNQLVGILSGAELLRASLPPGEDRELADAIAEAARRSAGLTRQLLAFARKAPVGLAPVDVRRVLEEVVTLLRHTIDRRVSLELEVGEPAPWVEGDAAQIHHAVLNLALNARDAMPEGGVLRLRARVVAPDAPEREAMAAELPVGPLVSVSVADDGAGIAPEVWSHLFEPFYTTKGGRGSGLGLAAVYGTVKAHRGGVDVRSAPGQGTTVTLWLPAIPPPAPAAGAAEPAAGPGRRRFLVVDDEPLVRAALDRLLRRGGHEVLLAEGGRAGLEVLARERGRIDAVFLDLMMPDVSGAEVLRLLRADEPELPVIVSSGFAGEGEAERLAGEPGVQVLPKPFSLAELNRVLAAAFPPGKGPLSR